MTASSIDGQLSPFYFAVTADCLCMPIVVVSSLWMTAGTIYKSALINCLSYPR